MAREWYTGMGHFMHLWERGPYAGRGPKGYQRSDSRIREDVCEILTQDGRVDASGIEVQVDGGQVTLRGSVADRSMKRDAEDMAIGVPGVQDVHNQLSIKDVAGRAYSHNGKETDRAQFGPLKADNLRSKQIRAGMNVVDMKGNYVGRIKAVRESDFLVDRSMARDFYIPKSTVENAENQVVLNVDEQQLESMNLPRPDIFSEEKRRAG